MRHARREETRLKAAVELRNWLFGAPSPDHTIALGGTLTEVRGEVVRFAASFGRRPASVEMDGGKEAGEAPGAAINVEGIDAADDEEVIEAELGAHD